jgi:hypothetical protein
MKLLKDILQSKTKTGLKYSQGRVYLFIAFVSYVLLLFFLTYKTIECGFSLNMEAPQTIIDALQWIIGLLAGYVFGGKGIEALKIIMNNKKSSDKNEPEKTPPPSTTNGDTKEEDLCA